MVYYSLLYWSTRWSILIDIDQLVDQYTLLLLLFTIVNNVIYIVVIDQLVDQL